MRQLGWALIQSDWCFPKKRRFGHVRRCQGWYISREERPREDTVRRWLSARQGERPQKKPNMVIPWSCTSNTQNCEKTNFWCLRHPQSVVFPYARRRGCFYWQRIEEFNISSFIRGFPYVFRISSFQSMPLLYSRHPAMLGIQCVCNSLISWMRFWAWFSGISALQLQEMNLFQGRHRRFQIIYAALVISLRSSFSLPTLFSNIRNNQPISFHLLVWQKVPKELHARLPRNLPLTSVRLGIPNVVILCICMATSHYGLSVLSLY